MILSRIEDPRDNLERATRDEVWDFAKAHGVHFDQLTTPKSLMEKELRARGLVNIQPAVRVLGRPIDVPLPQGAEAPRVTEVDALDDLARQLRENAARDRAVTEIDPRTLPMGKLRAELKRRGIKFDRRDKIDVLRGKLSEPHAA